VDPPRRIKAGAVLVRTWQGKAYQVSVLDEGFSFEGRTYPSLSVVAREITGTRWNGPRFFGLREQAGGRAVPPASARAEDAPRTIDMFESASVDPEASHVR
jgi:hypothetical protein